MPLNLEVDALRRGIATIPGLTKLNIPVDRLLSREEFEPMLTVFVADLDLEVNMDYDGSQAPEFSAKPRPLHPWVNNTYLEALGSIFFQEFLGPISVMGRPGRQTRAATHSVQPAPLAMWDSAAATTLENAHYASAQSGAASRG